MSTVPYNVTEQVLRLVFSNTEPYPPQKTMWAKRSEDDTFHFYVYNDGEWHDVSGSITIPEISVYLSSFINDAGFLTEDALDGKQDLLVSGENIKTVNNISVLGSGNIDIGTYTKPSGGIPISDLSQAVQASLDKADSAVQPAVIANMEVTNNKTDDISTNRTSTLKYPSSKGVADYVDSIVGDINTILDDINGEVI